MPSPDLARSLFSTLLMPPARLYGLGMRLARRLVRPFVPGIPCVGVGGMQPGLPGAVLVTSWLLGWAGHHGLNAAVTTSPLRGGHGGQTLRATPDADPGLIDAQAIALSMYAPHAAVISDADPRRAVESAMGAFRPDLLLVHDGFSRLSPARDAQIVVLGQDDLGPWFNRPVPAGRWREDASALRRADMFVVHMDPERVSAQTALITKRLARFGRPVVSVFPRAWRLRQAGTRETAKDFGGEPYLLLTTESERRTTPHALSALLPPPRLSVIFPDGHHFTVQDLRQIVHDATRLKCPRLVCPPVTAIRLAPRLAALDGGQAVNLWTYDPDVVFGASLDPGDDFRDWWAGTWNRLSKSPSPPDSGDKKTPGTGSPAPGAHS